MSTTAISHPSFSITFFTQLVQRLRYTNARYNQIAHRCRRTQRPTHHAKRRAYRAGLRIDTSKARVAWPGEITSAAPIYLLPVLDRSAGGLVWMTEIEPEEDNSNTSIEDDVPCTPRLGLPLRNLTPEVVVQTEPVTVGQLSPLQLGPSWNVYVDDSDSDACDLPFPGPVPVPGAPRWRSIPLPEDEFEPIEAMTFTTSVSHTMYDPDVWRDTVMATHVSDSVWTPLLIDASAQVDVVYPGLGITVPPSHLKRKLRDVEVDGCIR